LSANSVSGRQSIDLLQHRRDLMFVVGRLNHVRRNHQPSGDARTTASVPVLVALGYQSAFAVHFKGFGVALRSAIQASIARLTIFCGVLPSLSGRLENITGWRVVPVAGLVPDEVFFNHLANRRFPAGAFIRPEEELDYLQEPDVFHDIFGHVPLLANPVFADFMVAYGKGGQRAMQLGQLANLARLYWYTVEFGLIQTPAGLRIFGAGILSSVAESIFALESSSPNRVAFDLQRIMRTKYAIDDFQQTYFVIESFEELLAACCEDFGPLYERLAAAADIETFE
jgi:monomeric phenylalanine-4-hydroxylase